MIKIEDKNMGEQVLKEYINELKIEFAIDTTFNSCVSYDGENYTYDLDVIFIMYAKYFEKYVSSFFLKESYDRTTIIKIIKEIPFAYKNLKSIHNERKFRKEFHVKYLEIKKKIF